ncbi:MAG: hypothetical protein RBS73_17675 [Prolixibacteraceae bacterium]|jgi:hypothetical protein|nr:hypothetical protein [Prolixibacteraceae bacterium]
MNNERNQRAEGTYGYDVAFFAEKNIETIELKDAGSKACILLVPAYQGRVMTSSANGSEGTSYGWINYKLIGSGTISKQFNPFGGEERFWLGPEGGPYSIYFQEGEKQVYENWQVPPVLDTEHFEIKNQDSRQVTFTKHAMLKNASGTEFNLGIERRVSLLPKDTLASLFNIDLPDELDVVAYQTDNTITNEGSQAWTKQGGLLSIWMLGMFNPSPSTTVFIPYQEEGNGVIVNDNYFGKVPADRLIVENGIVYFKIDGKFRSKIGLPPERAKNLCGSFDSGKNILTLLWCSLPSEPEEYVNSNWGEQENPYEGDVVNSYNDGPVDDGSVMGPFYEIETSSPAAALAPGKSLTHTQRIAHIQGGRAELAKIVDCLFGLRLDDIVAKFQ